MSPHGSFADAKSLGGGFDGTGASVEPQAVELSFGKLLGLITPTGGTGDPEDWATVQHRSLLPMSRAPMARAGSILALLMSDPDFEDRIDATAHPELYVQPAQSRRYGGQPHV